MDWCVTRGAGAGRASVSVRLDLFVRVWWGLVMDYCCEGSKSVACQGPDGLMLCECFYVWPWVEWASAGQDGHARCNATPLCGWGFVRVCGGDLGGGVLLPRPTVVEGPQVWGAGSTLTSSPSLFSAHPHCLCLLSLPSRVPCCVPGVCMERARRGRLGQEAGA